MREQYGLTFEELRGKNKRRCVLWHGENGVDSWSGSEWAVATAGELGEACNVIKKLNRAEQGLPGNKENALELRDKLAEEIADTVIYLDLLAARYGIDLATAVRHKFNVVSDRNEFNIKL